MVWPFYAVQGHRSLHPTDEDLSAGTPVLHPTDEDLSAGTPVLHPTDEDLSAGTPVLLVALTLRFRLRSTAIRKTL
jgi:hypothetical protein